MPFPLHVRKIPIVLVLQFSAGTEVGLVFSSFILQAVIKGFLYVIADPQRASSIHEGFLFT